MPSSEQENGGSGALLLGGSACRGQAGCRAVQPVTAAAAPFRFHAPRCHIDWCALHALDLGAVVRESDIDALESVLDLVAGGDIEAEDARSLTPANFIQLFRTAQLTLDYLLHVQDRLAGDSTAAQGEAARLRHQVQLLQLKVKEVREELVGTRKEARHLKKSLRSFEALALAHQHAPPPPPEVRVVERVVEVADPAAASKLERVEAQVAQLMQERQDLQRDNSKLADALATAVSAQAGAEGSTAKAVELARREEQEAASERLQVALEKERKRHRDSKAKLSVVVSSDSSPKLQSKAAQRREREAEERAEAAALEAARASKASAAPLAEARRLRAQLESAHAEADMLRSRLAQVDRERCPTRVGSRLASSGLGAELEDADDARLRQLETQVAAQQSQLAASKEALAQALARCKQLEQQLKASEQQQKSSQSGRQPAAVAERAAAADVLEQQVERLREEKTALRNECRRLRQQAAQDTAEIAHLTRRLLQVVAARGSGSQPASCSGSPTKAAAASRAGGEMSSGSHTQQQAQQPAAERKGGIGSPIEEAAAGAADGGPPVASPSGATAAQRPCSRPGSARGQQRPGSPSAGSPPPHGRAEVLPSASNRRQFRREMQHALANAERPGVEELEAELAAELASYGLDPAAQQLSDSQLEAAMAQLERRRGEARAAMSASDRQRMDYMRCTAAWHVQRMAELASSQRDASPVKRPALVPPPSLKPIRTASKDEERASPSRRGYVEQVLDEVGDEDATYSPLGRGASVLSDRGYLDGDMPRSTASWGPAVPDSAGAPRSPWALTHERVFFGGEEMEGSQSPLAYAASPSRHASPTKPRAVRSVQFSGMEGDVDGGMAPVQRIGRRPSFSQPAGADHGQSPSSHNVQRHVEEITAAEPWDSRDWDTREAAAVRPPAGRYVNGRGAGVGAR
ncbi:hypothetical protein CHLNCDRAFT_52479 [Chlorella variabilis]|uniref:Cilium assembly protein DZIP1 N-terminal domain-containing protein n=1 Tax=Chlorella variabilis TaxID=554065 RepID=E1ZFL3_CHLVA|nr:hypothetical protein CHLNCDRAFT_52479 [Chlorella variabilis]EFN55152.1 hypothetical protein CHLNCDRAFT_52479 [Chlorella variabilis]|eukprot:XP_005847254.1 hypothetical protein CHLNCDRAFT_52479 [Chlorella variabilis]